VIVRTIAGAARGSQTMLVVYRSASDVAAKGAMFAVTVAAARQLSREHFALFAIASTLGWLGSVAADFGIQVHLARSVSQHPERSAGALRRWLPVRLGTGLAALGASLLALRVLGLAPDASVPMVLFTLAYAATGLSECLYYFFRGLDRTDIESTLTLAQRSAMCVIAFAVLWRRPSVTGLALAMLVPALLTLAVASVVARHLAASHPGGRTTPLDTTGHEFMSSVAPIGIGILLSALYFRIDVFLLERWSGTSSVAVYNAVFRVVDALRLFPAALLAVTLPALCRASDIRPLVRLAAPLTAAGIGAALVLWMAAGTLIPALYGVAYAGGVGPFRTLVLSLPLMALNYALTSQLIGWHGHRAYAWICAGALSLNVLLNWQLIPLLGMAGAAWATLWTEAFLTVGCTAALARVEPGARATMAPSTRHQAPVEAR
jgi:O-antigen/teichoic acid export membrane protein